MAFGKGFSLALEKPFGYAWYDMRHFDPEATGSERPMIRSQLDFPLDPFRATAGWSGERSESGQAPLRTAAEFWVSAGPAFFEMRDQDWMGLGSEDATSSSSTLVKFSDTRSRAETFQFGGDAWSEAIRWSLLGVPFAFGLGAGGWVYSFEVFGYHGRQLDPDGAGWIRVSASDRDKVGTYDTWNAHASLSFRNLQPVLGLDWTARIHALSLSGARDDHILRKKRIEMDCLGTGVLLEAGKRFPGSPLTPFARFGYERGWGRMRQTYYADSPDGPDDETGLSIRGIRTTVNAWRISLGMRWEWD